MTVRVTFRYSSSSNPNSRPSGKTNLTLTTTDTSYSALKAMIQAKYLGWHHIEIVDIDIK